MKRSMVAMGIVVALTAVSVHAQTEETTIAKWVSPSIVSLGDTVTVCLEVHNRSGEAVKVTDNLPNALSYLPGSLQVNGAPAVSTGQGNTVSTYVPSGFAGYIMFEAQVTEAPAVTTDVVNTAQVTAGGVSLASSQACMTVHNYCGFHKVTESWDPTCGYEPGVYSVTPIVPMFTRVCFDVKIWVQNLPGDSIGTMENVVVSDRFGGDVAVEGWSLQPDSGSIESFTTGKTAKAHLTWDIDEADVEDGETVMAILNVCTDINPGQATKDSPKYEYTEPCYHELNSGAVLKFIDPVTGNQLSAHTPPILVKAVPVCPMP